MNVSSRALVELVLLGPSNDRRQLQDSPVLGDVWIAYAVKPAEAIDLLITPYKTQPAGPVAVLIAEQIRDLGVSREQDEEAQVAYLQGLVAARLFFEEVLRVLVPMTYWWKDRRVQDGLKTYAQTGLLRKRIEAVLKWAQAKNEDAQNELAEAFAEFSSLDRYISLAGIILWAAQQSKSKEDSIGAIGEALTQLEEPDPIVESLRELLDRILSDPHHSSGKMAPQVWQVSLNRKAMPALDRSVPAVKGDAARTLFNVRCDGIRWAVLDSGIDGRHPVFNDKNGESRIIKAFDFSNIRKIVSLDNMAMNTAADKKRLDELRQGRKAVLSADDASDILQQLAKDAANDRPIHWELVEKFIEIDPTTPPRSGHGTHVAGIIGASAEGAQKAVDGAVGEPGGTDSDSRFFDGMCPDIKLYDFRVLAKSLEDTEFAIIAALQYLRYLNERHTYITVHGANLSLSIPHDVRNFACGRTPICNECAHLVESGVVVVAAAGNLGYQRFETKEGAYEGYAAFSITDPGNADGVITVGATHRYRPHTYGVSFFSSRGPTGDGRLKPDLVAPGERIESSLLNGDWGELDGTSMAAPHVSGAAAMLMARYDELIGEPQRVKRILCESATDLGRERSFQGHGMLDVLRAFQSI
jgi:serine protease AprX